MFGGGLSSRLFEEIRERRGLAYSVYSGVSAYADSGAFQMYAGTQPDHADEVIDLIRAELERLVNDGITDDELDIAIGYLTGAFELGLEDTGSRMARNGGQLITTGIGARRSTSRWPAGRGRPGRRASGDRPGARPSSRSSSPSARTA